MEYRVIELTNNINNKKYVLITQQDLKEEYFCDEILKRLFKTALPENISEKVIMSGNEKDCREYYDQYRCKNRVIYNPNYYNIPESQSEIDDYQLYISKLNKDMYKEWRRNNNYKYQTETFRQRQSVYSSGENNPMYGKNHSEESKRRMSENRKGLTCGEKNGNYGNTGEKAKNGKPVYQYEDPEMTKLIKRFNTIDLALKYLDLKGHSGLMKAIKNGQKYKGYYWSRQGNV